MTEICLAIKGLNMQMQIMTMRVNNNNKYLQWLAQKIMKTPWIISTVGHWENKIKTEPRVGTVRLPQI